MKYIALIFTVLLFASCDRSQGDIEFTGTAKGINSGNVVIRDQANNTIYSAAIESGKFSISKRFLQYSGYYRLVYMSSQGARRVEIYLQPGSYNIHIDQEKINDYPVITSTSKIQNELSAYHAVADSINAEGRKKVVAINAKMHDLDNQLLQAGEYAQKVDQLQRDQMAANQVNDYKNLVAFISKYPDNEVAPHIILQLNYQNNATEYYNIYKKLSDAAKSSDDGKELEGKLKPLTQMDGGASAPAIAGNTPDGKALDIKATGKKIILVDFWRTGSAISHDNHQKMIIDLLPKFSGKDFGIISVSFDADRAKWLDAIKTNKLNWPQVSDLKGEDSPNATSWSITSIPTYVLLDAEGNIIKRVTEYAEVAPAITDYLQKHP